MKAFFSLTLMVTLWCNFTHADLICNPSGGHGGTPSNWWPSTGSNGVTIYYPHTFSTSEGRNGQRIAYPNFFWTTEGSDGVKIAHPAAWSIAQGRDGRMIAYPSSWWTGETPSGRKYAYPPNGCQDPCALLEAEMKLSAELKPFADNLIDLLGPNLCKE